MIITRSFYMNPSSSPSSLPKGCCISRILRRILCFNSLPWLPLNQQKHPLALTVQEDDFQKKECSLVIEDASATRTTGPGLVARLMGLDSLPHYHSKESPASANVDNSLMLKLGSKGRNVIPACQELEEDEEFYTLRFGSSSSLSSNRRRKKPRSNIWSSNKENADVRVLDSVSKNDGVLRRRPLMNRNSVSDSEKATDGRIIETRKKKKTEVIEQGDESENSSPNSVLEFVEFPAADHRSCASSGEVSRLTNSKMRRTLSDELENCGKAKEKNPNNKNQICCHNSFYAEEELIGKLAAMDIGKSRWIIVQDEILKNDQCLKEIGRDVASDILDQLLDELVINDFAC